MIRRNMTRWDGEPEEGRRKPRGGTVKKVSGAPQRELPTEPGKSQPAKSPTEESLLLSWLCERVDVSITRKEDRAIARNVLRANVAALVHGRYEGDPSSLMTVAEVAEYAAKHPDDVELTDLREKMAPRSGLYARKWHDNPR
jgi:hypothetical protein